jgi:putative Mn2+ efflux pump MntP
MLGLLLVAVAVGLSNFAAAIGIGVSGVDSRTRLRVGVIFGFFETAMPIAGLLAGKGLAGTFGNAARWIGATLLIATGVFGLIHAIRANPAQQDHDSAGQVSPDTGRLLLTGLALSIDNLAVGFALGIENVSLAVAVATIGAVSVTMSLIGLELGHRLGKRTGDRGEVLGGLVLIGVGIAIATGTL